jgi:hypothetical protein
MSRLARAGLPMTPRDVASGRAADPSSPIGLMMKQCRRLTSLARCGIRGSSAALMTFPRAGAERGPKATQPQRWRLWRPGWRQTWTCEPPGDRSHQRGRPVPITMNGQPREDERRWHRRRDTQGLTYVDDPMRAGSAPRVRPSGARTTSAWGRFCRSSPHRVDGVDFMTGTSSTDRLRN